VRDGRTQNLARSGAVKGLVLHPAAYLIDYVDRTHATLLMLDGALADFNFAARVRGMSEPFSCQLLLPPVPDVAYYFSAGLERRLRESGLFHRDFDP